MRGGERLPAPAVVDVSVPALASSLHEALEKTADTENSGLGSCGVGAAEGHSQRWAMRADCEMNPIVPLVLCFQSAGTQTGTGEVRGEAWRILRTAFRGRDSRVREKDPDTCIVLLIN